jgi:hypothetical protein
MVIIPPSIITSRKFVAAVAAALLTTASGCTSLLAPMSGIPVSALPSHLLAEKRADYVSVPLALLRRDQPEQYVLDKGDILGIYIEGIMPPKNGEDQVAAAPPVHFPEAGSDLPPSVGYPIPVRDDGTLPLPLVTPVAAKGKTLAQVEALIRRAYVEDKKIIKEGRDQIIVSLMKERTYRVIVVREDGEGQQLAVAGGTSVPQSRELISGTERNGAGFTLDMPAYKNDVMHALAETGGLPGLNAKSEVRIMKTSRLKGRERDEMIMSIFQQAANKCACSVPCVPCGTACSPGMIEDPFSVTIPLRVRPGEMPQIDPADIVLDSGDIVYIESRDTEVFYTGGLLPGGQYPIPRDYDLDVIGAMSIAGTGLGGTAKGSGGGGGIAGSILGGGFGGATPTQLFVIRTDECGHTFNIAVDLKTAFNNAGERILIQPGDMLILRYKPHEELVNFGLVAFFAFGIQQMFR